jgi:dihydroorotate dehydrogenase
MTNLFHWQLPHPVIASSSPLTAHLRAIHHLFAIGAAAVVTKTISMQPDMRTGGCIRYGELLFNRDGYSRRTLSEWEADLETLRGQKVIANIAADTPEDVANLARRVVSKGAEIVELGLSCPSVEGGPICISPDKLGPFCRAARKAVDVPLIVKLILQTSTAGNRAMISCLKNEGINGVSISDTLPGLLLDVHGNMMLGGSGGISGSPLKPLVLKSIYDIADMNVVILGMGGISSGQDVVDYLRVGASVVQVCSFLMRNGVQAMENLVQEYRSLASKNISCEAAQPKLCALQGASYSDANPI